MSLCAPLFCDSLKSVLCKERLHDRQTVECRVPEWILCITDCEVIYNQKVDCGTEEIFVPGTVLIQYVWFDGSECRHGLCKIPISFTFRNPCTGTSEKVLRCNCSNPTGECIRPRIEFDRDPKTGKRRHASVVVKVTVDLDVCCLVDVKCPRFDD